MKRRQIRMALGNCFFLSYISSRFHFSVITRKLKKAFGSRSFVARRHAETERGRCTVVIDTDMTDTDIQIFCTGPLQCHSSKITKREQRLLLHIFTCVVILDCSTLYGLPVVRRRSRYHSEPKPFFYTCSDSAGE